MITIIAISALVIAIVVGFIALDIQELKLSITDKNDGVTIESFGVDLSDKNTFTYRLRLGYLNRSIRVAHYYDIIQDKYMVRLFSGNGDTAYVYADEITEELYNSKKPHKNLIETLNKGLQMPMEEVELLDTTGLLWNVIGKFRV